MTKTDIFVLLNRMEALIRSEERKQCAILDLQTVHLHILHYLYHCNKYSDSPSALADYLGVTRGTVSQSLSVLQKKDYISKTIDHLDRRLIHLELSPSGKALLEQAKPKELFNQAALLLKNKQYNFDYEKIFSSTLLALQKANHSKTFGLCKTCQYFTHITNGFMCGLTHYPLSQSDSEKICQEHKP